MCTAKIFFCKINIKFIVSFLLTQAICYYIMSSTFHNKTKNYYIIANIFLKVNHDLPFV